MIGVFAFTVFVCTSLVLLASLLAALKGYASWYRFEVVLLISLVIFWMLASAYPNVRWY